MFQSNESHHLICPLNTYILNLVVAVISGECIDTLVIRLFRSNYFTFERLIIYSIINIKAA